MSNDLENMPSNWDASDIWGVENPSFPLATIIHEIRPSLSIAEIENMVVQLNQDIAEHLVQGWHVAFVKPNPSDDSVDLEMYNLWDDVD